MSIVLDAPATTGTRIAELTRDGVTLRLSVTDGQPWIALERDREGRTSCIALPVDWECQSWLHARLADLQHDIYRDDWEELEP